MEPFVFLKVVDQVGVGRLSSFANVAIAMITQLFQLFISMFSFFVMWCIQSVGIRIHRTYSGRSVICENKIIVFDLAFR